MATFGIEFDAVMTFDDNDGPITVMECWLTVNRQKRLPLPFMLTVHENGDKLEGLLSYGYDDAHLSFMKIKGLSEDEFFNNVDEVVRHWIETGIWLGDL